MKKRSKFYLKESNLLDTRQVKIYCWVLDVAATELYSNKRYILATEQKTKLSSDEMIDYLEGLVKKYPIISIEDGLAENDWSGWKKLTQRIGDKTQVVGDDVFVTNTDILGKRDSGWGL